MHRYRYAQSPRDEAALLGRFSELIGESPAGIKFAWFLSKGYVPHVYQSLFHVMSLKGLLVRFRNLVAGRRGGKTLSAAWDVLFYALHPEQWHMDFHGEVSDEPLHIWVLVPDFTSSGRAAVQTLRRVMRQAGLVEGRDYKENRGDRIIEFANGTLLEYKTAKEPDKLIGAGIHILWIDEAGAIPNEEAWEFAYPALMDKRGCVICTTTPRGKNWYWEEMFGDEAQADGDIGSVEYRSIDNPYFPPREWIRAQKKMHPLVFKREMMASFDSMAGVALSGEWLHYYDVDELPKKDGDLVLDKYIGVDPAISLDDRADHFAMALIGLRKDRTRAYLLRYIKTRVPFPDQVKLIGDWHLRYRPMIIGVESNAYQAALAQQIARMPGFPPVMEVKSRGKKEERIMNMGPWFRAERVKIHVTHRDFVSDWLNYDPQQSNPDDDLLDAVSIALQGAGTLLPDPVTREESIDFTKPAGSIDELAWRHQQAPGKYSMAGVDPDMGGEW